MLDRIQDFIEKNNLFSHRDKLILAISGGRDSVFLFHVLNKLNYNFELAHCNFKLRSKESDDDEIFVNKLAKNYAIKLNVKCFETSAYAKQNSLSIQMAARNLRYEWLNKLKYKANAKYIITAHHKDDNVETFFINLFRGTGVKGLLAINKKNKDIVRPLLFLSREEINSYINLNNISYREDSSNSSNKYVRNLIRNEIIPKIKEINPSIQNTITNNIATFSQFYEVYSQKINEIKSSIINNEPPYYSINIEDLKKIFPKEIYMHELLSPFGFNNVRPILNALYSQSGKKFISKKYMLLIDRKKIILKKHDGFKNEIYFIEKNTCNIQHPINMDFFLSENMDIAKEDNLANIDFDLLEFPLILRRWINGDRFIPLGMKNFKKLSDFFIDKKLTLFDKNEAWVLCSANKDIVWVIGYRIDNRYKLTKKTKKVYLAKVLE